MARMDATAAAFVTNETIIRPVRFIFMDFLNDPVRVNDSGMNLSISGQTQPDLNGTYIGTDGKFTDLSPIRMAEGGSSTVTAKLSGIKVLDDATLDLFGDETRWKGRKARIWRIVWDQNNLAQGQYQHLYTGYMVDWVLSGNIDEQVIEVNLENYLVAFSQASNRTYALQKTIDPGDLSYDATVGAINGAEKAGMLNPGQATSYEGFLGQVAQMAVRIARSQ